MMSGPPSGTHERYKRRLSDKIEAAFDHACNEGELIAASELLVTLELVLLRKPPTEEQRESVLGTLYTCQERLWHLRRAANARSNGGEKTEETASGERLPPD